MTTSKRQLSAACGRAHHIGHHDLHAIDPCSVGAHHRGWPSWPVAGSVGLNGARSHQQRGLLSALALFLGAPCMVNSVRARVTGDRGKRLPHRGAGTVFYRTSANCLAAGMPAHSTRRGFATLMVVIGGMGTTHGAEIGATLTDNFFPMGIVSKLCA